MSRPKSARAAKPVKAAKPAKGGKASKASRPAAGRAAGGRPGVFVQKPKSDIYVALLAIALASILVGSLLLALKLREYDFKLLAAFLNIPSVSGFSEFSDTVRL